MSPLLTGFKMLLKGKITMMIQALSEAAEENRSLS